MLRLDGVTCAYGGVVAVRDISFEVPDGSAVALLGANGAGKTTTLRAVSGLLTPTHGHIVLDGKDVTRLPAEQRARIGIRHVPEGRQVFGDMTVIENLYVGATGRRRAGVDEALLHFPQLEPHLERRAGSLSGGQQQMLSLARALVSRPNYLLIDELSLGLAPVVVNELVGILKGVRTKGVTLLIVEQHLEVARQLADVVVTLVKGTITAVGPTEHILGRSDMMEAVYLGDRIDAADASPREASPDRRESVRAMAQAAAGALRGYQDESADRPAASAP